MIDADLYTCSLDHSTSAQPLELTSAPDSMEFFHCCKLGRHPDSCV